MDIYDFRGLALCGGMIAAALITVHIAQRRPRPSPGDADWVRILALVLMFMAVGMIGVLAGWITLAIGIRGSEERVIIALLIWIAGGWCFFKAAGDFGRGVQ